MSRRHLVSDAIGLGPLWLARDDRFADHPARYLAQSLTPTLADDIVDAEPVLTPSPDTHTIDRRDEPTKPVPLLPAAEAGAVPPPPTSPKPMLGWAELEQAVAGCTSCRLCETRTQTVFGRGNSQARWLIIGEAPGEQEDRQGKPFVGRAGQLLDNMLAAIGLDTAHDVYIANVLKCRPPGNRNPSADEIIACEDYLRQQIEHLRPTLILALGRFAAQTLLDSNDSIARLRGRVHRYHDVPLIVSFHPAYLLRNLPDKAKSWQDLVFARRTFQQLSSH